MLAFDLNGFRQNIIFKKTTHVVALTHNYYQNTVFLFLTHTNDMIVNNTHSEEVCGITLKK